MSIRYGFAEERGFIEGHARWITDPIVLRDSSSEGLDIDTPFRVGLMAGYRLSDHLRVSVAVENVLDMSYDDPEVDRDEVGVDARVAVSVVF